MRIQKTLLLAITLMLITFSAQSKNIIPDQKLLYKVINGDSLNIHLFKPLASIEPTAAIVFFFGGGWTGGTPRQFYQQSQYLASRGILAICAEYRIKNKHGTTPFDCVEDGKSAIRWVRQHAKELNIDPNKIVAGGASAGGHVAICTAIIDGYENTDENQNISSMPNAVIGYNPVFDTTDKGYGSRKLEGRVTEISPCHQVKKDLPPMFNFHGEKDTTVPIENAERFTRLMKEDGNQCDLVTIENVGHGFFNGAFFRRANGDKYFNLTMYDTDVFLTNLGYLQGKPTINRNLFPVIEITTPDPDVNNNFQNGVGTVDITYTVTGNAQRIDIIVNDGEPIQNSSVTGQTVSIPVSDNTAYKVEILAYIDTDQLVDDQDYNFEVGTPLSIDKDEIERFSFYPNPINNGNFSISTSENFIKLIQIYDVVGKIVLSKSVQNREVIDVSNLNAGMYILKVKENDKMATRKLIVN